jgi:DnaJ-class molecular chaperone
MPMIDVDLGTSNSGATVLRGRRPISSLSAAGITAADPRFERHDRTLYRVETVDVVDAVLGASVDVPTLDGQVSIKTPKGTQPNSLLWLRGKRLPGFGGHGPGDLYVRLRVQIPERLSEHPRSLFEQLRTAGSKKRGHCKPHTTANFSKGSSA